MPTLVQTWALPAALLAIVNISTTWYNVVAKEVPEPYLDEFFHVPQAQRYCRSDYTWDPKITTPPGLYLVAKLFQPLIGCDTASLRALNVGALCLICPLCYGILRILRNHTTGQHVSKSAKNSAQTSAASDSTMILDANTALNITLFPPLFFFSALFYTDVMSTFVVLVSYSALLKKRTAPGSVFENINAVVVGVIALLFRQTNIFWVAVFPAGLTVIDALKASAPSSERSKTMTAADILQKSWTEGVIHECSVQDAGFDDYVLLVLTVAAAALAKPVLVVRVAMPYLILLGIFAGFVAWNGSVVLGDKSAHTATVHLPQMLYIWPYIAFFSVPLMVAPLLLPLKALLPQRFQTMYDNSFPSVPTTNLPSGLWIAVGLAVVHLNTVVHPYTLADNRHYVFYVFKIFLRHPTFRYVVVPVYYLCAWLTFQALGSSSNNNQTTKLKHKDHPTSDEPDRPPCQISFITIWLATTALSLVSAPLVEPRYFIIPWIIWRLHIPILPASLSTAKKGPAGKRYDVRPSLETLWHLVVNAAVTYVFIRRPFEWPSEPGKVQRFLW